MLKSILQLDQWIFKLINQDWSNSFFDALMPFIRNQYIWVPLYLFLVVFVAVNFKSKLWWWILFFLATFALADLISSQLVKQFFERPRPCIDSLSSETAHMLIPCSTGYSFVSSHATNHFGLAMFLYETMKRFGKPWIWLVFLWAAIICYAQIYVGAHFPFDILGGALLGTGIGKFTSINYIKQFGGLQ